MNKRARIAARTQESKTGAQASGCRKPVASPSTALPVEQILFLQSFLK
ncbi:MAG: hypothetical protein OIN66_17150 [Candidatus Methanoperedens sp.]|nr:hypothetical protein [Candidatus Methanoperedens sp.]